MGAFGAGALVVAGVGREGSRMRVHEAPCVFSLMTEAFQPSERGSLVETDLKKGVESLPKALAP